MTGGRKHQRYRTLSWVTLDLLALHSIRPRTSKGLSHTVTFLSRVILSFTENIWLGRSCFDGSTVLFVMIDYKRCRLSPSLCPHVFSLYLFQHLACMHAYQEVLLPIISFSHLPEMCLSLEFMPSSYHLKGLGEPLGSEGVLPAGTVEYPGPGTSL